MLVVIQFSTKKKKKKEVSTTIRDTEHIDFVYFSLCMYIFFFFFAELYVCTYLSFKALLWHFWHDFVCTRFCRNNRTIYTICTFLQHLVWFVIIIRVRNCLIIFLLLFFIIYLFIYFLVFKSRYLSPFWQTDYLL